MPHFLRSYLLAAIALLALALPASADTLAEIKQRGELVWGTDLEGGAPFVIANAADPQQAGGFETEIGRLIARELGVKWRLVHVAWDGLVPALQRKNFDMALRSHCSRCVRQLGSHGRAPGQSGRDRGRT